MLQDGSRSDGGRRSRRPGRAVGVVLVAVVALIVAGGVYVYQGAKGYYTISPGSAPVISDSADCHPVSAGVYSLPDGKPCVRIVLPPGRASTLSGSIMMVDVLVGPTTPVDFLLDRLGLLHSVRDGTVIVPSREILGTTPPSQLGCQDDQQMVDSTAQAAVVALRRLGDPVGENDQGAQVDQVQPGTPAATAGIHCNDLVTAVNGKPVRTAEDLVSAVHALTPGGEATVTVSRAGKGQPQTLQLTARLESTPALDGQPADAKRAFLGVSTETRATYTYPFPLDIQVGQIGGPSAGLALTLGLLDSLGHGQLTGGLRVAATGTIDLQGHVGDVGGVAEKAVAVREAGAQVFFVPTEEAAQARGEAGSMKIYPVSTLAQALEDLQALGGHIPPPPTSTA